MLDVVMVFSAECYTTNLGVNDDVEPLLEYLKGLFMQMPHVYLVGIKEIK